MRKPTTIRLNVNLESNGTIRIQQASRPQFGTRLTSFRVPYNHYSPRARRLTQQAVDWVVRRYDI